MSIDLDDDLVIFIWRLFPGDHHLRCRQVLQLGHLKTHNVVTPGGGVLEGQMLTMMSVVF